MTGRIRFGIAFLHLDDWSRILERAERCEALGFDAVWIPDHFVFPWDPTRPWLDAWSLLAGLAARTHRIQLGSMVTHAVFRNPAVLARAAMTVDRMSDGRLQLGIGTGASDHDWTMTGAGKPWPFGERVDRFKEAVEIVDGLLRGTLNTYTGHYYQVVDASLAPGPAQLPRPRLVIGAGGSRMVKLAARYADAWVTEGAFRELSSTWSDATIVDVLRIARQRSELLSEEALAQGRDPATIGRVFATGFCPGSERPWQSVEAFEELVGRFHELGFDEFVLLEPGPDEWATFERTVSSFIPGGPLTSLR
jgi:alkanesulfonate monooxygenase SsuD/methylene tetrahydromethanopterin reductase-like flavin-dependent oxidoreductase (luciferase family)